MASCGYGIDLGTNNIKIYSKGSDEIFTAKNIIPLKERIFYLLMGIRLLICMKKPLNLSRFLIP